MTKYWIRFFLLAVTGWGTVFASDLPPILWDRVDGSSVAKGARYYQEYKKASKDRKFGGESAEYTYLFIGAVYGIAQGPMGQLGYFCVPEGVSDAELYDKVAPVLLREKWLWSANARVLVLSALGALYPCTNRTLTTEERDLAELLENEVAAAGAFTALQMHQLPDDVRTRTSDALSNGIGHLELRTRLDTSQVQLVLVPSDGSEPQALTHTK